MRILLIHNNYRNKGGEERAVFYDKKVLEAQGHKVIVYTRNNSEIADYGIIEMLKMGWNAVFSSKTIRDIDAIINDDKPDIAHIHNIFPLISPSVYYVLKKRGIPVVQAMHNYRLMCANGLFLDNNGQVCEKCRNRNYAVSILNKCYRKSYAQTVLMVLILFLCKTKKVFEQKVSMLVSPSNFLKSKLIEAGFTDNRIYVKPNCVDTDKLMPIEDHGEYAVYMGRISREKGMRVLMEAFAGLSPMKLKIIGDGDEREYLERRIGETKAGNIELLGYIKGDERFDILRRAMCLIMPSECYENMPYAILESFACGVPVIASRIGGMKELVDEGKTGYLFEPGDPVSLREKVQLLMDNKEHSCSMRINARKTAESGYSFEQGYKNLIQLYKKVQSMSQTG